MKAYVPRLKKKYSEKIAKELMEEFGYSSPMQIPRVEMVSVSVGCGEAISNKKLSTRP
jgi:large subunit ribosomal protein L5